MPAFFENLNATASIRVLSRFNYPKHRLIFSLLCSIYILWDQIKYAIQWILLCESSLLKCGNMKG